MSSALIEEPLCLLVGDVGGEVELGDLGVIREEEPLLQLLIINKHNYCAI